MNRNIYKKWVFFNQDKMCDHEEIKWPSLSPPLYRLMPKFRSPLSSWDRGIGLLNFGSPKISESKINYLIWFEHMIRLVCLIQRSADKPSSNRLQIEQVKNKQFRIDRNTSHHYEPTSSTSDRGLAVRNRARPRGFHKLFVWFEYVFDLCYILYFGGFCPYYSNFIFTINPGLFQRFTYPSFISKKALKNICRKYIRSRTGYPYTTEQFAEQGASTGSSKLFVKPKQFFPRNSK